MRHLSLSYYISQTTNLHNKLAQSGCGKKLLSRLKLNAETLNFHFYISLCNETTLCLCCEGHLTHILKILFYTIKVENFRDKASSCIFPLNLDVIFVASGVSAAESLIYTSVCVNAIASAWVEGELPLFTV